MVDLLSPDVISQEVQGRSARIPPGSTSSFAFAGFSPRGPEGEAFIHSSLNEYIARFGTFSTKSLNAYQATAYDFNGGNSIIFVRELSADAEYATGVFTGTWSVQASGRGVWANDGKITIKGNKSLFDQATATYSAFDIDVEIKDASSGLLELEETYETLNLTDPLDPNYILKILEDSEDVVFTALAGGVPPELSPITISDENIGTGDGIATSFPGTAVSPPIAETTMKVTVDDVVVGTDDGLGNLQGVSGGPSVSGSVDYDTGVFAVSIIPAPVSGADIEIDYLKRPADSVSIFLSGGDDGSTVTANDVVGAQLVQDKRGIYALDDIEEQFSLALADFAGDATTDLALITYAEGRKDVSVILQPPKGKTPQQAVDYRRNTLKSQSSYAAMYYPWVKIPDPLNGNRPLTMPPCGHVAGRYAFTDLSENVGKAPAGTRRGKLNFISGVERVLGKGDRNIVFQAQINPIRSDRNVGTAIWGNSTLQVIGDYTDVNIRRLFINLRKEQEVGLLDIVFEDVGPSTFGLIKGRLDYYLEQKFIDGIIGSGIKDKKQAFKVVVDESNNPQAIQITKRIIIDEFIKPNLAAEIIHLRLQRTFDASQA